MDISEQKQVKNSFDIASALGLTNDIRKVETWINQRNDVKQAFLLNRKSDLTQPSIIAYIQLHNIISKSKKKNYIDQLKAGLFAKFNGYLLPCLFAITDDLEETYTKDDFELRVLKQKIGTWDVFDTRLSYWSDTLTNIPHLHNLSTDKAQQVNHTCSRQKITKALSSQTFAKLNGLSKELCLDTFIIMQTVFTLLLNRYSNDSDILTSASYTLVSSINKKTLYDCLIKDLLLRSNISNEDTFRQQLEQNTTTIQHALLNQVCYSELDKSIRAQEHFSGRIFQIKLNFHRIISEKVEALDHYLESIYNENILFGHDLELNLTNTNQGMFLNWFYDENIFEKTSINRLSNSFTTILEAVLVSIDSVNHSLPLIEKEEANKLINYWNQSKTCESNYRIDEAFSSQALETPTAIALKSKGKAMTYEELNTQSSLVAKRLNQMGVAKNTCVAVYMKESFSLFIAIIGILKARCLYLPLDVKFPNSRLEFLLNDSGVSIILTTSEENFSLNKLGLDVYYLDSLKTTKTPIIQSNSKFRKVGHPIDLDDCAYLMYTSGSTREPKGVIGTHNSVMNRLNWMHRNYPIKKSDIFCLNNSVSAVDHITEIFQPLVCGASLVFGHRQDYQDECYLISTIEENEISRITILPSVLKSLLSKATKQQLGSLKIIISSGEALSMSLVETCYKLLGNQVRLLNLYGSTETGADVSCHEVNFDKYSNTANYFSELTTKNVFKERTQSNRVFEKLHRFSLTSANFTTPNISLDFLKEYFMSSEVPNEPISIEQYLTKLTQKVLPYMVDISSSKYIGHMTSPLPSFIPELSKFITQANQNVVKVETAKSLVFLERQVLAMLHRLFFNLNQFDYNSKIQDPYSMFGLVTSGGSIANITALYCARNSSLLSKGIAEEDFLRMGATKALKSLGYNDSVIIVSKLAHYSIKKTAALLGIGQDNILTIEQDDSQKINTLALENLIRDCNISKRHIIAIIGIAGATETGTIDPLDEMANIARKHNLHFHVDGAWGGAFIFSKKYKHKLKGIEKADSITICAHKQLFIAQGMSVCLFKDPKNLFSISTHAEYQSKKGSFDLGQYTLEGSRPALSMLLHAAFHLISIEGYAKLIENSMEKTSYLSRLINDSDCFQLVGENDLNILNYRYIPRELRNKKQRYSEGENLEIDRATELIQRRQFQDGKTFVSRTKILFKSLSERPISVFRVVLANPNTSYEDLLEVLDDQLRIAAEFIERTRKGLAGQISHTVNYNRNDLMTLPLGNPIDNVKLYVLDDYLSPSPIGVIGELYVAGSSLSTGYINNPKLNKLSYLENPFSSKFKTMFKTNDLVKRLSDGSIEYIGRKDQQIKLKGHRLRLNDVQEHIDKIEMVKRSVVLVEKDILEGNALTAYIELDLDLDSKSDRRKETEYSDLIKSELSLALPEFMVPSVVKFWSNLPVTPNGKIDYTKLE